MSVIQAKHRTINRNQIVPRTRFSGFKNVWKEVSFGFFFEFKQTNSFSREDLNYKYGEVKNIHYGDIHTKFRANFDVLKEKVPFINTDIDISKIKNENYCLEGDLIIADASEDYEDIGKAIEIRNLNNEKVVAGLHTFIARPISESFAAGFLGYLMHSKTVRHQIKILAQGTKVLGVASKHLSEVLFKIPSKEEQQKITIFLSTVDDLIENLKDQKEKLELYKKGMMQKIFSQKICFKDINGLSFDKWQEIKLGDLFKERIERNEGQKIDLLSITLEEGVTRQDSSIKRDSSSSDKSNYKIVHVGDIAYNTMRMWQGAFGVSKHFGITSPAYTIIFLKNGCIDFFGYLFKCPRTIFDFYRYSQGLTSDTWNLKYYHFSKVTVRIPVEIKEQQKIADFLTSLDKGIESKQQQISKAEEWKKGLMQGLFV